MRLITKGTHTSDRWKRNEKPRPKWSGPTRRSGRIRTGHLQRTLFCWRKTLVGWRPLLLVTRNYLLVFFCASRPLLSNCCSDDAMVLCRSATAGGSFRTFGCRMAVVAELCNIFVTTSGDELRPSLVGRPSPPSQLTEELAKTGFPEIRRRRASLSRKAWHRWTQRIGVDIRGFQAEHQKDFAQLVPDLCRVLNTWQTSVLSPVNCEASMPSISHVQHCPAMSREAWQAALQDGSCCSSLQMSSDAFQCSIFVPFVRSGDTCRHTQTVKAL